ncbi:CAP domain-containing protein [Strongyloides ratti]|uniref:CAP domain-containing protein n=1 Tax=Strongyloides ratti TaxID=34506 RepID=A0A090L8K0_STRRB|nr:CAP domain-containing protein [Strongyloides ratti]CEF66101.1 CAP domain-containing protein [Strongyloides ratti]
MDLIFIILIYFSSIILFIKTNNTLPSKEAASVYYNNKLSNQHNNINKLSIISQYRISKINLQGTYLYKCNGRYFDNFYDAYKYAQFMIEKTYNIASSNNNNPFEDFNVQSYLGTNAKSIYIWRMVWNGCDYKCFSSQNYKIFRLNILKEINLLRKYHYSYPLLLNNKLEKLAQKYAEKSAKVGKLLPLSIFYTYGQTMGIMFYLAGNTIVNRWYQESKYYDYKNHRSSKGLKMFTQLVWRRTKFIGIGVAKTNYALYIVCLFHPKGNVKNKFKENVIKPIRIFHE